MNRRALLTGGSALALLALRKPASAVCALPAPEHPMIRARRLAWELSDTMNDYEGGEWHAIVHPSRSAHPVAFFMTDLHRTAEERIDRALATIKAALAEKYPDHFITSSADMGKHTAGVVVAASRLADDRAQWWLRNGPLLAVDAGTLPNALPRPSPRR